MNKLWYIHTMEYLAIKREKPRIMKHVWISKALYEGSQTQKAIHCMIPFIWHSGKGKTVKSEIRSIVAKELGWVKWIDCEEPEATTVVHGNISIMFWLWQRLHDYTFVKCHQSAHVWSMTFSICKLCLSKLNHEEQNRFPKLWSISFYVEQVYLFPTHS